MTLELKQFALTHAVTTYGGNNEDHKTVLAAAKEYFDWLIDKLDKADKYTPAGEAQVMQSQPAKPTKAKKESAPAPTPAATAPAAADVTPAPVVSTGPAPASAAPAVAPTQTSTAQPAAAQPAATNGPIPPPTTIAAAAESLKALVQDKTEGRGRAVAIAILKEYGVEQLSQVAPAKLAELKFRFDTAGKSGTPAPVADPTGGLLG